MHNCFPSPALQTAVAVISTVSLPSGARLFPVFSANNGVSFIVGRSIPIAVLPNRPASRCTLTRRAGFEGCTAQLLVGQTCTVSCSQGFQGAPVAYICQLVAGMCLGPTQETAAASAQGRLIC
jgi:hypothetical protein